jgi:hypothetical protein
MGAKLFSATAMLSLCLLAQAKTDINNHVINGTPVTDGTFNEVVNLIVNTTECSATVIGPRTILTAGHCATDGATGTFTISGHQYSALMSRNPLYPQTNDDLALGLTSEDIQGVQPASIGGTASVGLTVTILGYGCTAVGGGPIDGILRMGNSVITTLQDYYMITNEAGGAALCYGDSGGPAIVISNGVHEVLGINSEGNIQDTNYDTRTDLADSQTFFQNFASKNNTTICGVNATCSNQPNPPSCSLTASPTSIAIGQNSTLTISAQNATSATINGQPITLPSGQLTVTPTVTGTQTYQGTITGQGGNASCNVAVTVTSPQPTAPSCSLVATPNNVKLGDSLNLQLTAQGNATSATIDGNTVAIPSGSQTLTPTAEGTYTSNGTVTGPGGSGSCTVTYSVAKTVTPSATPNLAVVSAYCGENTLQSDIYTVCLAVIARDSTVPNLAITNAVVINYRDLSQEVLPIINRVAEASQSNSSTVTEDLTLYANGTVNANNVVVLDSRSATLTSNPSTHAAKTIIPTSIVGRSIKGVAFSVSQLKAASSASH